MSNRVYSWARFAIRTAGSSISGEGRPTKLIFVVTKRCHSRCVYCDIWKLKDSPGLLDQELSLAEVEKIARANSYLQWIDFTGGEPTDRSDFVEVVQSFARSCPDLVLVHFPTNGIATKRIVDCVRRIHGSIRSRIVVTISIDGPPSINDKLRGIRNDFSHAVETFYYVREQLGPKNVFVGMTLHGQKSSCGLTAAELVEQTFAAVNEKLTKQNRLPIDWQNFHLNIPHLSEHYYGNIAAGQSPGFGSSQQRSEISEALKLAASKSKASGSPAMRAIERIYRMEALSYLQSGSTRIACSALLSTIYLSEKGEVYPCTIWDKPLGSVRTSNYEIMPIIENAKSAGVRKTILEGRCPRCWTPCEAYPAIAASPIRSLLAFARRAKP